VWLDAPLRPAKVGQVSGLAISEEEAISVQLSAERKRSCLMLKAKNGQ